MCNKCHITTNSDCKFVVYVDKKRISENKENKAKFEKKKKTDAVKVKKDIRLYNSFKSEWEAYKNEKIDFIFKIPFHSGFGVDEYDDYLWIKHKDVWDNTYYSHKFGHTKEFSDFLFPAQERYIKCPVCKSKNYI